MAIAVFPTIPDEPAKPMMRGVSHQISFFVALAACILLIARVPEAWKFTTTVYALSLIGLFGISALYHRPKWSPGVRQWIRRADHAGIILLIAGSSTPFSMVLPEPEATHFLMLVWFGGLLGIARALFWINAPKWVAAGTAVVLGWSVLPYVGDLYRGLGFAPFAWLVVGGVMYSVGAVIYARKRPDPWPMVFGYHEIFHALVVLAAAAHFGVVAAVALRG